MNNEDYWLDKVTFISIKLKSCKTDKNNFYTRRDRIKKYAKLIMNNI